MSANSLVKKLKLESIKEFISLRVSAIADKQFENNCRKRLKNEQFSIICSNCIGGVIYHRLGKQFLSPTVNLWFHQNEFIKFIFDLESYLNEDLVFVPSEYNYPVGQLKDVKIYFNHYRSEDEAKQAWDKRKKRVDYDNLYIILYDRDGLTKEDIESLSNVKCKRLIVLSDEKYDGIEYVKYIKRSNKNRPNEMVFLDKDFFGKRTFEKQFDFVGFLNGEDYSKI